MENRNTIEKKNRITKKFSNNRKKIKVISDDCTWIYVEIVVELQFIIHGKKVGVYTLE